VSIQDLTPAFRPQGEDIASGIDIPEDVLSFSAASRDEIHGSIYEGLLPSFPADGESPIKDTFILRDTDADGHLDDVEPASFIDLIAFEPVILSVLQAGASSAIVQATSDSVIRMGVLDSVGEVGEVLAEAQAVSTAPFEVTFARPLTMADVLVMEDLSNDLLGPTYDVGPAELVEIDEFPDSWAEITLALPPLLDGEVITFTGPATVEVYFDGAEGETNDTDGDGLDQVATQMVEMELVGESKLLGPIAMRLRGDTFGEIEETENLTAGVLDLPPFADTGTAFSYFDVLFEVELLQPPDFVKLFAPNLILLHNEEPVHMTATIDHKPPPLGATYSGELADPVSLYDDDGNLIGGTITACVHSPDPSPVESTLRWADVIWTYELPLCWTVCTRQRLCRGLVVEVMLQKFDAYLDSDMDFMTPELHLHASIIKNFLEHATPAEIEQLACTFANAYLEAKPCREGSPCVQD